MEQKKLNIVKRKSKTTKKTYDNHKQKMNFV